MKILKTILILSICLIGLITNFPIKIEVHMSLIMASKFFVLLCCIDYIKVAVYNKRL